MIAIYIVQQYFEEQWASIFAYQNYSYLQATKTGDYLTYLLSGRNMLFLSFVKDISGIGNIIMLVLVGISPFGVFQHVGNYLSLNRIRGIEMDPLELFFSYGIIVMGFCYSFFIRALSWRMKNKSNSIYLNLALICTLIYSVLGGHAMTEAISGTYCAILIAYKFTISEKFMKRIHETKFNANKTNQK